MDEVIRDVSAANATGFGTEVEDTHHSRQGRRAKEDEDTHHSRQRHGDQAG